MDILIACEKSGIVREAFRAKGHNAISCDLQPSDRPGPHIQGDIIPLLAYPWDMVIGFPPCTFTTNSGVRWLYEAGNSQNKPDPKRWENLIKAVEFFRVFLNHPCPRKAVENPIQHSYAKALIGQEPTQIIQPWMFGHPEQKATCLWLTGLPPLEPTNNVKAEMEALPQKERSRIHYASPGPDRSNIRSQTFEGIAAAMAEQWG